LTPETFHRFVWIRLPSCIWERGLPGQAIRDTNAVEGKGRKEGGRETERERGKEWREGKRQTFLY